MSRYQGLAVVTVIATLLVVAVGSAVRTTGSGLGCPDWPLCHGQLLPPLEREAIFEWSHRTVAAIAGLLIIVLAAWTLLARRDDRPQVLLAIASLPLLAMQAFLGRRAVLEELPAGTVALHMLLALALVSILAVMAAHAWLGPRRRRIETSEYRAFRRLSLAVASVVLLVIAVGTYTVATHAGFGCIGWPDCPQARVPFIDGGRLQHIHWLHRLTVLGGLAAVALLAYQVREIREAHPPLRQASIVLLGLYVAQVLVGAGNIWSDFAEIVRIIHLVLGASIMALAAVIAVTGTLEAIEETSGPGGAEAAATAARQLRPRARRAQSS